MPDYNTVALTGHRPNAFTPTQIDALKAELDRIIVKLNPKVAISGFAMGSDLWWAQTAMRNNVELWGYLPGANQTTNWHEEDQQLWEDHIRSAEVIKLAGMYPDFVESISGPPSLRLNKLQKDYTDFVVNTKAYHARNRAMVDDAELTVVVWAGKKGGTEATYNYIKKTNTPHIMIDFTLTEEPKVTIQR